MAETSALRLLAHPLRLLAHPLRLLAHPLRLLAHPLRLLMLSPPSGASFSAMGLSRELSISHALASYHLRQLHAAGVIELVEVRPRNGARERRFSDRPDPAQRAAGPGPTRKATPLAEAVCVELRRRSGNAVPGAGRLGVDAEMLWVGFRRLAGSPRCDTGRQHDAPRAGRGAPHHGYRPVSVSAVLFAMADRSATLAGE